MGAFHAYDIRGVYNVDFDKDVAYKVGYFLPELLSAEKVLVGRDARVSSDEIHEYLLKGITDAGADVYDIGLSTTPMVYFGTANYGFKASVQITASHNPAKYNGLKVSRENALPVGVKVKTSDKNLSTAELDAVEKAAWTSTVQVAPIDLFLRALYDNVGKQFNSAQAYYTAAVDESEGMSGVDGMYRSFYLMNRGVLRAEMIDFISSIESNVQVLSMDDSGNTRARVKDQITRHYDYSDAIEDMKGAAQIVKDIPYIYYNLGNLYCLSSELVNSIENYTKAIELYPYRGDAYFNRGLVLIYLKDKEKGCIDLSRAGELGVQDAYGVIKKYCEEENE